MTKSNKFENVGVIINCYNCTYWLENAINSVLRQDYPNIDLLVFDNCSTDSIQKIKIKFGNKVRFISSKKHLPLSQARQAALDSVQSSYICFLDSDDEFLPEKISKQVKFLNDNKIDSTYGGVEIIDEENTFIRNFFPEQNKTDLFASNLMKYSVNFQTFIVRKKLITDNKITFRDDLVVSPDFDFVMKCLFSGKAMVMRDLLSKYRLHKNSLSMKSVNIIPNEYKSIINGLRDLVKDSKYDYEFRKALTKFFFYENIAKLYNKEPRLKILAHIVRSGQFSKPNMAILIMLLMPLKRKVILKFFNRL